MASQVVDLSGIAEFDSYTRGYHAYSASDVGSPVVREILLLNVLHVPDLILNNHL